MKTCHQKDCKELAIFRYTWPGQDEKFICLTHAEKVKGLANAIGLYIQLIVVEPELD